MPAEPRFGRLALHSWTVDAAPLDVVLDAAGKAGFDAVELRWLDFERCPSHEAAIGVIRRSGMPVAIMGVEPGWIFATGEESIRLFGQFRHCCETAVALDCGTLMSAPGPHTGSVADAIINLRRAGGIAAEFGLRLAVEFAAQHPVLNCLEVQREIVSGADMANCGLLLDAYHLERSGGGGRGFEAVPVEDIFVFQFSDVPDRPMARGNAPIDRLPPGQGVVRWRDMFGLLAEKSYRGYLSYEAPNPLQWARSPYEVAAEGVALTRMLLNAVTP